MSKYILKRLFMMIFVVLGVTVLIFTLLYFTSGDPALQILGPSAADEEIAALRTEMGLDDSYLVRLGRYFIGLLKLDLGISYRSHENVVTEILKRFPITMLIGVLGLVVSIIVGVVFGIISAVRQYSWLDRVSNFLAVICASMPQFWFGLELSLIFALRLKWLPPTGYYGIKYLILPVVTMGLTGAANFYRITRSSMLEVIRMDYIRTAKSKGQTEFKVVMHHALKNALIPIITTIGSKLGATMAGSVLIESIFAIPGLGSYMLTSINNRDYPVIQGSVLILALFISVVMLLTDIVYAFVDPRIKSQFKTGKKK